MKDLSDCMKMLIGLDHDTNYLTSVNEHEKAPEQIGSTDLTNDQTAELYRKMMR